MVGPDLSLVGHVKGSQAWVIYPGMDDIYMSASFRSAQICRCLAASLLACLPPCLPPCPAAWPPVSGLHRTVFESVDDETVVFVLGDHGMTEDGNHGGATPEETGAALLVWSRSGERLLGPDFLRSRQAAGEGTKKKKKKRERTEAEQATGDAGGGGGGNGGGVIGRKVAQIDLVPTISLLLGTPIPFGSLGGVIPEVFAGPYYGGGGGEAAGEVGGGDGDEDDPRRLERLCDALLVNSVQVGKDGRFACRRRKRRRSWV